MTKNASGSVGLPARPPSRASGHQAQQLMSPKGRERRRGRGIVSGLVALILVVLVGTWLVAGRGQGSGEPGGPPQSSEGARAVSGNETGSNDSAGATDPNGGEPVPFLVDDARSAESWNIAFRDEFDGDAVDDSRWMACYWWDRDGCTNEGNNELQWYLPAHRSVEDGTLRLEAVEDPIEASDGVTYQYRSGMVTTGRSEYQLDAPLNFAFTYGYVEARMRPPVGQGLWPALWLLPASHEELPEIDIYEVLGDEPDNVELHMHAPGTAEERISFGGSYAVEDNDDGWHVVAVDWRPGEVVWFVDGVERFRVRSLVPDEPMYLLANLAVGGDWPGAPDESTPFPAAFEIDYIRVWQQDLPGYTATGSTAS